MFETLQKGFRKARQRMQGELEIDEKVIDSSLRDIKLSLLEADVDLNLTKTFLGRVREKAVGEVVRISAKARGKKVAISAADAFVKICEDELVAMMGPVDTNLAMAPKGTPTGVMMVGLNGVGKTTTTAKLAGFLVKQGHKPLMCAADVYRPAAIEQLQVLGKQLDLPVYADFEEKSPIKICEAAMKHARSTKRDMVLFDTAGRQTVDDELMQELFDIKKTVKPKNIFLVADAMIGQDAVKTASEFNERLGLSGVILTKLDGDARGGAAISIKNATGTAVKFAGTGETVDRLEEFRAEGMASRILGMGDVVGLMKDFEDVVDEEKAEKDAKRMLRGQFTLDDFLEQLQMLQNMGPLQDLLDKVPFFADSVPDGFQVDEREIGQIKAIVSSMTRQERAKAELFQKQPTRLARVAKGSGTAEKQVAEILQRFAFMKQMMGSIGSQAGMLSKIPGMKQMAAANRLRDAVKTGGLEGNPMMANLTDSLLEAAVAEHGGFGPGGAQAPRKVVNKSKQKAKRKMQKKSRRKSRR